MGAVGPGESQKTEERFQRPPCTEAWHLGQKHLLERVRAEGGREASEARVRAARRAWARGKWGENVEQSLSEGEEAGLAPGGAASSARPCRTRADRALSWLGVTRGCIGPALETIWASKQMKGAP